MPPPDRMLNTLRRAIDFVKATPGRSGHLVHLRDCTEVLVAGDLHGNVAHFQTVLRAADLAAQPTRHLVFQELIHGSFRYPAGGDKSHQLVDLFAALKCQFPGRVHFVPGNHELAQWTDRAVGKADESYNALFRKGVTEAYGPAAGDVYRAYCDLFRALPLALRTPNRVFISHSLPSARYLETFQASKLELDVLDEKEFVPDGLVYGLVWGRDATERTVEQFLFAVDADWLVSGHIPTDEGFFAPNSRQVVVDCSASPAAYLLVAADRPLTHDDLLKGVVVF